MIVTPATSAIASRDSISRERTIRSVPFDTALIKPVLVNSHIINSPLIELVIVQTPPKPQASGLAVSDLSLEPVGEILLIALGCFMALNVEVPSEEYLVTSFAAPDFGTGVAVAK